MTEPIFTWNIKKQKQRWYDLKLIGAIAFFLFGLWLFFSEQEWEFPLFEIVIFFGIILLLAFFSMYLKSDINGKIYDDCLIVEDPEKQITKWGNIYAWKYDMQNADSSGRLILYLKATRKSLTNETYHQMLIVPTSIEKTMEEQFISFLQSKLGQQLESWKLPGEWSPHEGRS